MCRGQSIQRPRDRLRALAGVIDPLYAYRSLRVRPVDDANEAFPGRFPMRAIPAAEIAFVPGTTGSRYCRWGCRGGSLPLRGAVEERNSRHLPEPAPNFPCSSPPPDSSACAVKTRASPAGKRSHTSPFGGGAPRSSMPVTVMSASSVPGLTRRRELTWRVLRAGLKKGT